MLIGNLSKRNSRRSISPDFGPSHATYQHASLPSQDGILRIKQQVFGSGGYGQVEFRLWVIGKHEGQKVRMAVLADRIERHGGDHIFGEEVLANRPLHFQFGACAYKPEILQRKLGDGCPVDPAIKKPVQRLLAFIEERRGQDLLKGMLEVASRNFSARRFG